MYVDMESFFPCKRKKKFNLDEKNTYFEELKNLNQDLLLWVNKLHVKHA